MGCGARFSTGGPGRGLLRARRRQPGRGTAGLSPAGALPNDHGRGHLRAATAGRPCRAGAPVPARRGRRSLPAGRTARAAHGAEIKDLPALDRDPAATAGVHAVADVPDGHQQHPRGCGGAAHGPDSVVVVGAVLLGGVRQPVGADGCLGRGGPAPVARAHPGQLSALREGAPAVVARRTDLGPLRCGQPCRRTLGPVLRPCAWRQDRQGRGPAFRPARDRDAEPGRGLLD